VTSLLLAGPDPVIISGASKGSLDSVNGPRTKTTFFSRKDACCLPLLVTVPRTVKVADPPNRLPNLVHPDDVLALRGGS
jgi:hypothetical protein